MKMTRLQTMSCIFSFKQLKRQSLLSFCFILADDQFDMCQIKKPIDLEALDFVCIDTYY